MPRVDGWAIAERVAQVLAPVAIAVLNAKDTIRRLAR